MLRYNFSVEQLTHTATLKSSSANQDTHAQRPEPETKKPNPMDPIAHWPPEMLYLVNRNPHIRLLLLEALEKESKLHTTWETRP